MNARRTSPERTRPSRAGEPATIASQILLDIGAVLFRPERPFFFSSGWASPVYIDARRAISYPLARDALVDLSIERILDTVGYEAIDGVAGADGGGVPFAAIIAERLHLPLLVARKQAAGIGPGAQLDGVIPSGGRLLLVDDVTTDGHTKANMCAALRRSGASVAHAFVVFKYGIFDALVSAQGLGVNLFALASWPELLAVARAREAFSSDVIEGLGRYLADPLSWSADHGGRGPPAG